jgi:hypothetical protein
VRETPGLPTESEAAVAQQGPTNATILIIRHAEAPPKPSDTKKEKPGTFNPDLTPAGQARANAYAAYFDDWFSADGKSPVQINRLFAADESPMSRRPILTLEPLSHQLNLYIDHRFKDTHYADLATELQTDPEYAGDTILICWHHGHLIDLANALGMPQGKVPPTWKDGKWPGSVYGYVAQLVYDGNGQVTSSSYQNEELMYGDASS